VPRLPCAVCDTTGLAAEEFLAVNPSAAGAVVIDGDGNGLEEVPGLARGGVPDTRVAARRGLRAHHQVDGSVPAPERFRRAVAARGRSAA